jgi:hypothetical protein
LSFLTETTTNNSAVLNNNQSSVGVQSGSLWLV